MATPLDVAVTARVDDAIARVLEAERSARSAVAQCAQEAEAMRQAARARAHAIAERAAERTAAVHRWTDVSICARIDALNRERALLQQPAGPAPDEPQRLTRALDRLADELVGGAG
jgi:predicted component of type VI protein secretion system